MHKNNMKYFIDNETHTMFLLCFIPFMILGFKLVYFEAFIIDVRAFIFFGFKKSSWKFTIPPWFH